MSSALNRNSAPHRTWTNASPMQSPTLTRPPVAKLAGTVSEAFVEQFLPQHSRILELDSSTLKFGSTKNGTVPFSFAATESVGGFAGPVVLGTEQFTGSYDLRTGSVTFKEA